MSYEFDVITLFPEMFSAITQHGVTGKANKNDIFQLHTWNPRDFTKNIHRTVDDSPYGGGPGMVMQAQPLEDAISGAKERQAIDIFGYRHIVVSFNKHRISVISLINKHIPVRTYIPTTYI